MSSNQELMSARFLNTEEEESAAARTPSTSPITVRALRHCVIFLVLATVLFGGGVWLCCNHEQAWESVNYDNVKTYMNPLNLVLFFSGSGGTIDDYADNNSTRRRARASEQQARYKHQQRRMLDRMDVESPGF